jgi:hypothetical protein
LLASKMSSEADVQESLSISRKGQVLSFAGVSVGSWEDGTSEMMLPPIQATTAIDAQGTA